MKTATMFSGGGLVDGAERYVWHLLGVTPVGKHVYAYLMHHGARSVQELGAACSQSRGQRVAHYRELAFHVQEYHFPNSSPLTASLNTCSRLHDNMRLSHTSTTAVTRRPSITAVPSFIFCSLSSAIRSGLLCQ